MRRHSDDEVSTVLQQARKLELAGHSQLKICEMLDISVMTLHRWRNMGRSISAAAAAKSHAEENRMLRKIVSDLLLEIAELKEIFERRRAAQRAFQQMPRRALAALR